MKIGEQLTEGLSHLSRRAAKEKAIDLLQQTGIYDPKLRMQQYPHELSGGQKQRIMIAIALINSPQILIADELTTALDATIQAQILSLLKTLQQDLGVSIILITHDMGIVEHYCDRVIVMYGGQIIESAPSEILFHTPKHPYTKQLLASIPKLDSKGPLHSIPGIPHPIDHIHTRCDFCNRCSEAMSKCSHETPPNQTIHHHTVRCFLENHD